MRLKNLFIIFIISLFFLLNHKLFACSCDGGLTFCEATTGIDNDLIVSGKITYVDSLKLRLLIIDRFKGNEIRDTITIWSGTDFDCNGLFSMSTILLGEVDDSIIIILPKIDSTNIENDWDVIGDYRRPYYLCITPNLNVKNNSVFGEIKDSWPMPNSSVLRISYNHFKNLWNDEKINCSGLVGVNDFVKREVDFCWNNGSLNIDNSENLFLDINIFDQTGKRLFSLRSSSNQIMTDQIIFRQSFIILQIKNQDKLLVNEKIIKN